MWWSFLRLDWLRGEINIQTCYRRNGTIQQHFAVAHHKDGDWSTAQRNCRPTTCGWRNGQCFSIQRFLRAQQWKQQYPYQCAEFVELKYPVHERGCRQKCLDRKLAMISSYILFFHTSGVISAWQTWPVERTAHFVLATVSFQNYPWIQRNLKSNSMLQKYLYRFAQCISGMLIQFPSTLFQWLEQLLMLLSARCMFSGLLPPSSRSRATLLLVLLILLQDYTFPSRTPELYLWSGTCHEASSKQVWLLVISSMNKITYTERSCVWLNFFMGQKQYFEYAIMTSYLDIYTPYNLSGLLCIHKIFCFLLSMTMWESCWCLFQRENQ